MTQEQESNPTKICPHCSSPVQSDALFCSMCGNRLEHEKPTNCASCSAPLAEGAQFCSFCGMPVRPAAQQYVHTPQMASSSKRVHKPCKYNILTLIRNCLLVLMSILVTVFAFFSVATYDMSFLGMDINLELTPVRAITIYADTFKDLNEEELLESDIYDELELTATEFFEDALGMDSSAIMQLFSMQSDNSTYSPDTVSSYPYYYGDEAIDTEPDIDPVDPSDGIDDYDSSDIYGMLDDISGLGNIKLDLTDSQQKLLEKLVYLSLRMSAQSEEVTPTPIGCAAAVGCALFVLACVAFLVLSILNLVLYLLGKRAPTKSAVRLMPAAPLLAMLAYFACINWINTEGMQYFMPKMGVSVAVALISGAITLVACIVLNIIVDHKKYTCGRIIVHAASFAVALLTVCMVFAPVMSTSINTVFNGGTNKNEVKTYISSDYFETLNMGEDAYDEYKEQRPSAGREDIENSLINFEMYTKSQVKNGDAKHLDYAILTETFAGLGGGTINLIGLFSLIPVLMFIAALAASLVIWQTACYFLMGKSMKSVVIPAKVITVICAAAALALIIVFVCIINYNLEEFKFTSYSCSFTAASIIFVIAAIATASVPLLKEKPTDDHTAYTIHIL